MTLFGVYTTTEENFGLCVCVVVCVSLCAYVSVCRSTCIHSFRSYICVCMYFNKRTIASLVCVDMSLSVDQVGLITSKFNALCDESGTVLITDLLGPDPDRTENWDLVTRLLSPLSGRLTLEAVLTHLSLSNKERLVFDIYDCDKDGYISPSDLFSTMKIMVRGDVSDLQLLQLVDRTVRDHDLDRDGKLDFSEFKSAMKHLHIDRQVCLDW